MKYRKIIALVALIPLLTFCTNQRSEKSHHRVYTSDELIGKWNQVGTNKSQNDADTEIEFIRLVNDSVAEVQIIDSTGERKISGTWKNQFEKEIKLLGLKIESDICITYFLDDNHPNMLLLKLGEKDEKLIMSAGNNKFKKE